MISSSLTQTCTYDLNTAPSDPQRAPSTQEAQDYNGRPWFLHRLILPDCPVQDGRKLDAAEEQRCSVQPIISNVRYGSN